MGLHDAPLNTTEADPRGSTSQLNPPPTSAVPSPHTAPPPHEVARLASQHTFHLQSTVAQNQTTGTSLDDPDDNVFPFPELPPDPSAGQRAPSYIDPRILNSYSNQVGLQLQGFPVSGYHPLDALVGPPSHGTEAGTSGQGTIGKNDAGCSQSMLIEGSESKSSGKRRSRARKPNPKKDKDAQDRFRSKKSDANTMQSGEFNRLPPEYRAFVEMRLPEAYQARAKGNETPQNQKLHQADAAARTAVVVRDFNRLLPFLGPLDGVIEHLLQCEIDEFSNRHESTTMHSPQQPTASGVDAQPAGPPHSMPGPSSSFTPY